MTIEELTSSVGKLRLVGQGAEAEVFEWRDGRVLKLLRARGATERLACEVAAFEAAHSAGLRVPRAYEQVVMDGGPGPRDGAAGRYRSFVGFGPEAIAGVSLRPTDGRDPGPHQWRSGASVPAHGETGQCEMRWRAWHIGNLQR